MDRPHLKLSELRDYLDSCIKDHGDLEVSITLPGWVTGAEDPESQQHTWNFGIYVLDLVDTDENGEQIKTTIASLGHVEDYEDDYDDRPKHLSLVKDNS